jgi:hypothetical protein
LRLQKKPNNIRKTTTDDEHIQHNCQRRQIVSMMIMQRTQRVKEMQNREEVVDFWLSMLWVGLDAVNNLKGRTMAQ